MPPVDEFGRDDEERLIRGSRGETLRRPGDDEDFAFLPEDDQLRGAKILRLVPDQAGDIRFSRWHRFAGFEAMKLFTLFERRQPAGPVADAWIVPVHYFEGHLLQEKLLLIDWQAGDLFGAGSHAVGVWKWNPAHLAQFVTAADPAFLVGMADGVLLAMEDIDDGVNADEADDGENNPPHRPGLAGRRWK